MHARASERASAAFLLLAPLVAVAVAYRSLPSFGFVSDARFLIAENRALDGWGAVWQNLRHDYFWSSSGASIPYFRPFTKASWAVEANLWGHAPAGFFSVQLGWLLILVSGVSRLARALGATASWAAIAALLFGLHPSVIEPACLLMARSDLTCAAGCVWAIVAWLRWTEAPGALAWAALHSMALLVAFGSKETAIVLVPVLVLARALNRRRGAAVPGWTLAPVITVAALYLGLRRLVLHEAGPSFALDGKRLAAACSTYLPALLPLRLSSGVRNLSLAEIHDVPRVAVALVSAAVVVTAAWWTARRRDRSMTLLLGWAALSLAPVLLVGELHVPGAVGKVPLADRWLLQAVAAVSIAWALLAQTGSLQIRRLAGGAVLLWAGLALVVSGPQRAAYANELTMLDLEDEAFLATPEAHRTDEDRCRYLERGLIRAAARGAVDEVLATASQAERCPNGAERDLTVLSALTRAHRYPEALPVVERLLRAELPQRDHGPLAHLAAQVLLETGAPARAEPLFLRARSLGLRACSITEGLARCAAEQGRADEAARLREDAATCRARRRDPW